MEKVQHDILRRFSLLNGNAEMITIYLIELGKSLPVLPDLQRNDTNLISGCHSKVWLTATLKHGKVWFTADSNAAIVRGILSLLLRVLNGRTPTSILEADLYFISDITFKRFLGSARSEGFKMLIARMRNLTKELM